LENEIKIFYDLTAERTADEWYKEEILKPTILDFVSLLSDHPRILDLGCGTGHESMRLASTGADVLGIGFSVMLGHYSGNVSLSINHYRGMGIGAFYRSCH